MKALFAAAAAAGPGPDALGLELEKQFKALHQSLVSQARARILLGCFLIHARESIRPEGWAEFVQAVTCAADCPPERAIRVAFEAMKAAEDFLHSYLASVDVHNLP